MARVERSALLGFTAEQLLLLVRDVAHYPEFLPGCSAAILDSDDGARMLASLSFKVLGITESFATENTTVALADGSRRMDMRLLRGPFKSLKGAWLFQPLGDAGCKVSLSVELEWGSLSLGRLLSPQLESAASAVITAFKRRAQSVYGAGNHGL